MISIADKKRELEHARHLMKFQVNLEALTDAWGSLREEFSHEELKILFAVPLKRLDQLINKGSDNK